MPLMTFIFQIDYSMRHAHAHLPHSFSIDAVLLILMI